MREELSAEAIDRLPFVFFRQEKTKK